MSASRWMRRWSPSELARMDEAEQIAQERERAVAEENERAMLFRPLEYIEDDYPPVDSHWDRERLERELR